MLPRFRNPMQDGNQNPGSWALDVKPRCVGTILVVGGIQKGRGLFSL